MNRSIVRTVGISLALALISVSVALASSMTVVVQERHDTVLKDRIAFRLETSPMVERYDLQVSVDGGLATIAGAVATAGQRVEAARLADVEGVTAVQNNIVVDTEVDRTLAERAKADMTKTGEPITDGWITAKIRWFFVGDDLLKGREINVDTNKHVVTLKGTVTTSAGKNRAGVLAKRTSGVHRVVNQLTIGPPRGVQWDNR